MDQIFDTESAGTFSSPLGPGMSWKEKTNNSEKSSDQLNQIPFHPILEKKEIKPTNYENLNENEIHEKMRNENENEDDDEELTCSKNYTSNLGAKDDYLMVDTHEYASDKNTRITKKKVNDDEIESTINPMMVNVCVDDQNDDDDDIDNIRLV